MHETHATPAPGPEDTYEIYAICYGNVVRRYGENFIMPAPADSDDIHDDDHQVDFNFYIWFARSPSHTVVIDTGFDAGVAQRRRAGRQMQISPDVALAKFGIDAGEVREVIVTHLHYDHIGNFAMFPKASFHLQEREMMFATGKNMAYKVFSNSFEVKEVMEMVKRVYEGRVQFHDGDVKLNPGLSLHRIGGHTDGLQVVRVYTRLGWMVLASDALHLYANAAQSRPFPIIYDLGAMVRGWSRLSELADSPDYVIPGHDALVMERYPRAPELEEYAVRLDVKPQPLRRREN